MFIVSAKCIPIIAVLLQFAFACVCVTGQPASTETTTYPKYQPNDLVKQYHSADLNPDLFEEGLNQTTLMDNVVSPFFLQGKFIAFVVFVLITTVLLCGYNCFTCSKFNRRKRMCCGLCCCSVIPSPIRYKVERMGIWGCLVFLFVLTGVLVGASWTLNTTQSESLNNFPTFLNEATEELTSSLDTQVDAAYTTMLNVTREFTRVADSIDVDIAAANTTGTTLLKPLQTQDISAELLEVLRQIDEKRAQTDNEVTRLEQEAQAPIDTIVDVIRDSEQLNDTVNSLRSLQVDVADAVKTVDDYRSMGFMVVVGLAVLFVVLSFAVALSDGCCKRWDCVDCINCQRYVYDQDDGRLCCSKQGFSPCGCGRDHYGCSCGFSCTSVSVMLFFFVISGIILVFAIVGSSVCNDPFPLITAVITSGGANSNETNQALYYVQCHSYTEEELVSDFPLNEISDVVKDNVQYIYENVQTLQNNLTDAGFSVTTLAMLTRFNTSVEVNMQSFYGANGIFGFNGPYGCTFMNKYVHQGLFYVCDDLYSSVAEIFDYWVMIAILLCFLEIGQKCARREDSENMLKDDYDSKTKRDQGFKMIQTVTKRSSSVDGGSIQETSVDDEQFSSLSPQQQQPQQQQQHHQPLPPQQQQNQPQQHLSQQQPDSSLQQHQPLQLQSQSHHTLSLDEEERAVPPPPYSSIHNYGLPSTSDSSSDPSLAHIKLRGANFDGFEGLDKA